jgi:cytochrome c-type biogenesis protein CcmF
MEKRNALKVWTILLAILTFSLSLIGTFLVRSGVLTSVHAFATDPTRGVFILAILVLFIGGSLTLFAWRAPMLKQGGLFAPISREGALVFNNLFLTTACLTVFVGTLYPLALEALTGEKISVGPPFYNVTFGPLMLALIFAMPFGPLLAWKRGDLLGVAQRLMSAFALGLVAVGIAFAIEGGQSVLAPFGIGLAFFVIAGAAVDLAERIGLFRVPLSIAGRRAAGLPRSAWGTAVAHTGLALTLLGIIGAATWGTERIVALKPSQTVTLSGYELTFQGLTQQRGPNYTADVATFVVRRGDATIGVMAPSKRHFSARAMSTNEAALKMQGLGQLYLSIGDVDAGGALAVRLYYKPLVLLIWFGAVVMMLGGALSLSDRRLRVGAPKPGKKPAVKPAMQAAE